MNTTTKLLLAVCLGTTVGLAAPIVEATPREAVPMKSAAQVASEWQAAWAGLTTAERAALSGAWQNAVDAVKGLSQAERQALKAEIQRLVNSLNAQQKEAIKAAVKSARAKVRAMSAAEKQQLLSNTARAIDASQAIRAKNKARLRALTGGVS